MSLDLNGFWKRLVGVITILTAFMILVTGGFLTVHSLVTGPYCDCGDSLLLTVVGMSLTGVIVGITIYYYLSGSFRTEKEDLREKALKTTRFLPEEQRSILNFLIDREGVSLQKEIVEGTDLGKVKVSRTLKKMEKRKIVEREENGMSKKVEVAGDLRDIMAEK